MTTGQTPCRNPKQTILKVQALTLLWRAWLTSRPMHRGCSSVLVSGELSKLTHIDLQQYPLQQAGSPQRSHYYQHRVIHRCRPAGTGGRRTGTAAQLRRWGRRHHGLDSQESTSLDTTTGPAHYSKRRENHQITQYTANRGAEKEGPGESNQWEERGAFRSCRAKADLHVKVRVIENIQINQLNTQKWQNSMIYR